MYAVHTATTIQFEANDYPTMLVAFVTANDAQTTTYFVLSTLMFCQTITNGQHKQNFTQTAHGTHARGKQLPLLPYCLLQRFQLVATSAKRYVPTTTTPNILTLFYHITPRFSSDLYISFDLQANFIIKTNPNTSKRRRQQNFLQTKEITFSHKM